MVSSDNPPDPELFEVESTFSHWDLTAYEGEKAREHAIQQGEICPYCGERTVFVSSSEVYFGKDYGMIYLCRPCQAWVGTHKNSSRALGRIANAELRVYKQKAHACFDRLWKPWRFIIPSARNIAYTWLSLRLRVPISRCHIGMFDVEECKHVVDLVTRPRAKFDFQQFLEANR